MAPLPLAKLGSLLIKTLSKPVAKRIKSQMIKNDITRDGLIWVGQKTHALTTRMEIWSSGYTVRSINKLEETEALSRGADILSETFLFGVSGVILVYEYNRSSEKERLKEEKRLQQIRDDASKLQAKLVSLDKRLEALEAYAQANRKSILGLDIGNNYNKPENVVPILDNENDGTNIISQAEQTNAHDRSKPKNLGAPTRSRRWFWPF